MMRKNKKIANFNSGIRPDRVGVIIFALLLIYMIISIVMYVRSKHIVGYEVMAGSISQNNLYTGIALRDEELVDNDIAGTAYYFATEDRRVACGDLVYIIDEADSLAEIQSLAGNASDVSLSDTDYAEIQNSIENYVSDFDSRNFSTVYDFKASISGTVSKLVNESYLGNIDSMKSSSGAFSYKYAPSSGIVIYSQDGYEDLTLQDMHSDLFDQEKYEKNSFSSADVLGKDSPAYKLVHSENWSVVIQVEDAETAQKLMELEYIRVRFLKNQVTAWGQVSTFTNDKGEVFVQLSFTNSMITFATDRFLQIELITEDETGLKIPNSSIMQKNFMVVPKSYITQTLEGKTGVNRKIYLEDGSASSEFVESEIYNETEDSYYLSDAELKAGDILIDPGSSAEMTLSDIATLTGVYNINKGYADFKQIEVLYGNDEYSIVKSNTTYGLNVYDYIVLDASTVTDDELIYH